MTLIKSILLAAIACFATVVMSGTANAIATGTDKTFLFSGECDDCAGPDGLTTTPGANLEDGFTQHVTGTLVLKNFIPNTQLNATDNFVSFTYNGSSILDSFTVTADQLAYFSGMFDDEGNVTFSHGDHVQIAWLTADLPIGSCSGQVVCRFVQTQSSDAAWFIQGTSADDIGIGGTFTSAAPVPEPATLALLGLGLAGLGLARRKKAA